MTYRQTPHYRLHKPLRRRVSVAPALTGSRPIQPLHGRREPVEAGHVGLGGESFVTLAEGLHDALWILSSVPAEHRTDSLSTAFRNQGSDGDSEQDLTTCYELLRLWAEAHSQHFLRRLDRLFPAGQQRGTIVC